MRHGAHRRDLRVWIRKAAPDRRLVRADLMAGLPGAISGVPDGMAAGVLAGVSPVHGLYAGIAGPIAGGLTSSTRLMVITTTSAAALAAGSALSSVDADKRAGALGLLTLVAGVLMIGAGLLRLGRYTRFVSHSVMIGFLSGVAVNIVLGQVSDLTGASPDGELNVVRALSILRDPGRIDGASLAVGAAALVLLIAGARTRLATFGSLVALVVPTAAVILLDLASVAHVNDTGEIPKGVPLPALPDFGTFSASLVTGAFAVAVIVLVQGAGVAESAGDRARPSDTDQDFRAQGIGNVAASLVQGMPVGGSVGQTALNAASGARSRWSTVFCGIWMIVLLVACSALVGEVAIPTLAAILIVAALRSLRVREVATIWRTGPNSQVAITATFLATLVLPVAVAVGVGVVLSLLLQLNQEAIDLSVVQLVEDQGEVVVTRAPVSLESRSITVLDVFGSLFYAGARTLQARLPDPTGSQGAAVILRLRGRTSFGATFFSVVDGYARALQRHGGRLYLTGLDPLVAKQLAAHAGQPLTGAAQLFVATDRLGESTHRALADARTWAVGGGDIASVPPATNDRPSGSRENE